MAPSTVFSYWRRDHRRSSASPVSSGQPTSKDSQPISKGNVADNPPQLPQIPNTPTLSTSIGESSPTIPEASDPRQSGETSPDTDLVKPNSAKRSTSNEPSSSSTNLAVPPSSSERRSRPHSSPEERGRDIGLTTQSNHSQSSFTGSASRHDYGESDTAKPNSQFRLSRGKGLLNTQSDSNKRLSAPGMAPTGHFRFKPSPDSSPADKAATSQKDWKFDGAHLRRHADREVPTDNQHHKSGKAMLHLLNPMALLAKRRSSQFIGSRAEDINIASRNVPAIPDDYDPRIRGNIVHDFSAPRPRRNVSAAPSAPHDQYNANGSAQSEGTQRTSGDQSSQGAEGKKRHSEYSPIFKEHFDDDQRLLQVENKAYLQSSLLTDSQNHDNEHSVPAFAKNLPSRLPNNNEKAQDHIGVDTEAPDTEQNGTQRNDTEGQEQDTQEEGTDVEEKVPQIPSSLPRRFKSNASRFSFDMNAVESSASEKLLEEKHKEKEAARRAKAHQDGDFSDFDDDYDDMMDDADDLEEKIPGVNVDADEEEFNGLPGPGDIANRSWFAPGLSPVVASPISPVGSGSYFAPSASNARRSLDPETIGASSIGPSHSPSVYDDGTDGEVNVQSEKSEGPGPSVDSSQELGAMKNFGISSIGPSHSSSLYDEGTGDEANAQSEKIEGPGPSVDSSQDLGAMKSVGTSSIQPSHSPSVYDTGTEDEANVHSEKIEGLGPSVDSSQEIGAMKSEIQEAIDDDDLYFDDGEFGDLDADVDDDGEKFDESIFDDENSHLYDRKPPAQSLAPPPLQVRTTGFNDSLENGDGFEENYPNEHALKHVPSMASGIQPAPSINYGPASERVPNVDAIPSGGGVLTEHNLEALHHALAKAANEAARTSSASELSAGQESAAQTTQTTDSHPGLVSDDSRLSQAIDICGVDEVFDDMIYDDDTSFYDDPIIAAANAEALENDDEGFYGQEFGFYAHTNGNGGSQLTNGGYFGPRGIESLTRSFSSSRGKFREPSLTPITERSEWSTRNSVISLPPHGTAHSNPSLSSPGLAQLVDMGNIEDEMSLSALMKLRRDAFGGSNSSLRSRSASPPPHQPSSSNRASFTGLSDVSSTGLDSKLGSGDPVTDSSPTASSSYDLERELSRRDLQ